MMTVEDLLNELGAHYVDHRNAPIFDELDTPLIGVEFHTTKAVLVFDDPTEGIPNDDRP